jgi:protein-disulfide isomerase
MVSLLLCLGCSAQPKTSALSPDVSQRIERQIRVYFNLPPDVDISLGTPTSSEFPDYEVVPVTLSREGKTQHSQFLLSKDDKTLVRFTKLDLTQDPYAETMQEISLVGRPVRGNPDAKVTIVNFDDFECPFCAHMHHTLMNAILPQYGNKVKIVYKDYPLIQIHPWAEHAAIDANCLAEQSGAAYWQLADYLHTNQRNLSALPQNLPASLAEIDRETMNFGTYNGADLKRLQACIKAQSDTVVKASMAEGDKVGVNATPTVFINGERLEGAQDVDTVKAALNRQLLAAGVQPPAPPAAPPHPEATSK